MQGPFLRRLGPGVFTVGLLSVALYAREAEARPGTHAPAVSTFDTRASSVVWAYRRGIVDGGGYNTLSYNANFTNTTGVLSSQFGVHYINFKGGADEPASHGVSGAAVGMFNIPLTARLDNGLPGVSMAPYLGAAPTALINGSESLLSLPVPIGLAFTFSPGDWITISPWFEAAISSDLDSKVLPANLDECLIDVEVGGVEKSVCELTEQDLLILADDEGQANLDAEDVSEILAQGVEIDFSVSVPMRAGLDFGLHLGDSVDFNLYGGVTSLASGFSGTKVLVFGGGLVWRWDDIVPAVLPPHRRLLHEDCEAVEERFRSCPAAKDWRPPAVYGPDGAPEDGPMSKEPMAPTDERSATPPVAPTSPAPAPTPAKPEKKPAPPAPAPPPQPSAPPKPSAPPTAGFPLD